MSAPIEPTRVGILIFYVRNRRRSRSGKHRAATHHRRRRRRLRTRLEDDFQPPCRQESTYHTFFRNSQGQKRIRFAQPPALGSRNFRKSTVLTRPRKHKQRARSCSMPEAFLQRRRKTPSADWVKIRQDHATPSPDFLVAALCSSTICDGVFHTLLFLTSGPHGFRFSTLWANVFARPQEMLSACGRFHSPTRVLF